MNEMKMKIEEIIEFGESIINRKRELVEDLTESEYVLIAACKALRELQAENKELRDAF